VRGPVSVDPGPDNLVRRTLRRMRQAGWRGGSSDAAAVLRGVRARWGPAPGGSLEELAAGLGADVPFFLEGGTALGRGIGQRLQPLPPQRAFVLLAVFPEGMSSRRAFESLEEDRPAPAPPPDSLRRLREEADPYGWRHLDLHNDFTALLRRAVEGFQPVREALGAFTEHVAPTGSGSTLYGLFREESARDRACRKLRREFPRLRWIATRFRDPEMPSRSKGGAR